MGQYRDDLSAAHQRIAALEAALAARPAAPPAHAAASVPESSAQRELQAYATGAAIPSRLRWVGRASALAFLAAHAALAFVRIVPHLDGWTVFRVVSFLVPLPLALSFGRFARALVDPSVGHFDPGDPDQGRGPSVVRYSRPTAAVVCALLLGVEVAWVAWALPALQHAGRRPCPTCLAEGAPPR